MNDLNFEEKVLSNYVNNEFSSRLEELEEIVPLEDNNCFQIKKNESRELLLKLSQELKELSNLIYLFENLPENEINHIYNIYDGNNSNNKGEIQITAYKEDIDVETEKSGTDQNMAVQKEENEEKIEEKNCINRYSSSSLECNKNEEKLNDIKFYFYFQFVYKYKYFNLNIKIVFALKKYNFNFLIQITNPYFMISDGDLGLITRLLKDFPFSLERFRNADLRKNYQAFIPCYKKWFINKTLYNHFSLIPKKQKRKPKKEKINKENKEKIKYPIDPAELKLIKEGRLDVDYFLFMNQD